MCEDAWKSMAGRLDNIDQQKSMGSSDHWNWSKTVKYTSTEIHKPDTVDQIKTLLETARNQGTKVKCVGSGHSWNDIADTEGIQISMENFKDV